MNCKLKINTYLLFSWSSHNEHVYPGYFIGQYFTHMKATQIKKFHNLLSETCWGFADWGKMGRRCAEPGASVPAFLRLQGNKKYQRTVTHVRTISRSSCISPTSTQRNRNLYVALVDINVIRVTRWKLLRLDVLILISLRLFTDVRPQFWQWNSCLYLCPVSFPLISVATLATEALACGL